MRIIPKNAKIKMTFYKNITLADVLVGFFGLVLIAIALSSNLSFRFMIAGGILIAFIPLFISINGDRLYKIVGYFFKHLVSRKRYQKSKNGEQLKNDVESIIAYDRVCGNGIIALKDSRYIGVMEIHPVDFRMLGEFDQNELIDGALSRVLNNVAVGNEADIVKLERPLILDNFVADEMERIVKIAESKEKNELNDGEYITRVDVIQDRITTIDEMNSSNPILYARYYLVLQSGSERDLKSQLQVATVTLQSSGIEARTLNSRELVAFIRYSIDSEFDERNIGDKKNEDYLMPENVYFGLTTTQQNGKALTHFIINNYPLRVGNGWGEGLFDIPNTKVVMKMKPVEKFKAIRRIDNAILEVQTQNRKNRASDVIEKDTHLESLQRLLLDLQNENDVLFDTTIILTAYDEKGRNTVKKQVRRRLREMGFGYNEMIGRQMDAYLTSQICSTDKLNLSRGIQTSSIAAVFPFISNAIVDDKGLLIGENKLPVFVDFTKRDEAHLSSNMLVLGNSGSGKSYACKSIIAHIASCNTRVFVLDPESEYGKLCQSFGGKVLDVSSGKFGKLNPFHIIRTEDDENSDGTGNDYFAHLQFIEEFYRVVLPGINADSLELLNKLTQELYEKSGITAYTDLSVVAAKQYPTFDDLGALIDEKTENEKDEYNRGCLKVLTNYISKFRKGGRYSNLWNGATSFNPQENFVVFDFQKLLANKNNIVANAQMLLIVKWLENEVVKNKDYNLKHGTTRRLVVAVDEAHLFIDEKYPIALDFMASLAKRIRKYEGMLITITQSVKDVAGTPEIARKSQALIDVCQYSLIFSLSPNDMSDLCDLYAHAGQINEAEQNYIMHNKRGTAFFISSSQNRTNIDIVTSNFIESLF